MEEFGLSITPLLLIPGVAMLIMSTSTRYNRLHDEVHDVAHHHDDDLSVSTTHLRKRARLFRDAMVCLYVSVVLLALASLVGSLAFTFGEWSRWGSISLTSVSVAGIMIAGILLVVESRLSLEVIEDHLRRDDAPRP